jgi:Skp family chaperone for outer membrane proteins
MKLIIQSLTAIVFCSVLTGSALAQGRVGTIDLRKVFDKYYLTQQFDAKLKEEATGVEKDLKGYDDDFKKAQKDYADLLAAANDQTLSSEERDKRKAAAEKKLLDIREIQQQGNQFKAGATTRLDEQRKRMRDNLLVQIRGVVNTKAKALGYTVVVDTAAETVNNTPVVLYNSGENDMTEAVLTTINATAPVDLPKADDKKTEPAKSDKK